MASRTCKVSNPFIAEDADVQNSDIGEYVKVFQGASIRDSALGISTIVGNDATVLRSSLGSNVSINRRNFINDSKVGDRTYTGISTCIHKATVGKYCCIAGGVDIGGADHGYSHASSYPLERLANVSPNSAGANRFEGDGSCELGNDVWIGSGAIVLGKVCVGDGAVIGAGAVVTKDLPAYSIAVGIPARVVGYRFSEDHISRLEAIRWWDWPEDLVLAHAAELMGSELDDRLLCHLEAIGASLGKANVC